MMRLLFIALVMWTGAAFGAEAIFLVSRKDMPDPNFRDTVVLLTSLEGKPFGVILNRPTRIALSGFFSDLKKNVRPAESLHFGGPVAPHLVTFLFKTQKRPPDVIEVVDGVYLGSDRKLLEAILSGETPVEALRVFGGYAGWAPGQLESEVSRGHWHLEHADAKAIFETHAEKLWPELNRRASRTPVRLDAGKPARPYQPR